MKKKILASNGNAYVQQNLEVLPDASLASIGQVATVTAGGNVAFVDPFLKSGGTINGTLNVASGQYQINGLAALYDNGGIWGNLRVVGNMSGFNNDGIYLGYNQSNAAVRLYDGGVANYLNLVGATFSTVGINKWLFGSQSDDGTFAQFSGAVKIKSDLTVTGTNGTFSTASVQSNLYYLNLTRSSTALTTVGNAGFGLSNPLAPVHAFGGTAMTAGWSKTSILQAQYPVQVFNSNSTRWAGIGYDSGYAMRFWVNATSDDVAGTGVPALSILNNGNINTSGGISSYFFKLPNASSPTIVDNGSDNTYINARVIYNASATIQDGLYLGYANNSGGANRIYDGGGSNYVRVGSSMFSSVGITKWLFGDQSDNGIFAQFAGLVHAKSGLYVNGDFSFGSAGTRTETLNDAGEMGGRSGFFESYSPVNFPAGASSWWHLISARHSNTGNNYAMQIAGSFFDQRIYFRKTSNNGAMPWREFVSADASGNVDITGAISFAKGINVTGNGAFFNAANKFGMDIYGGNTRFYSSGVNTTTRGGFEFHTISSDGTIDNATLIINSLNRIGINKWNPLSDLDVSGNINTDGYLLLGNVTFALNDGTYQRIYKRNGNVAFSIANNATYYDNDYHIFRKPDGTEKFTVDTGNDRILSYVTKHLFGSQSDDGTANQFAGAIKAKSDLTVSGISYLSATRFNSYVVMNNNAFQYWKDSGGADRRFIGLSGGNFFLGDIDNTISGSSSYYLANSAHVFCLNGLQKMSFTASGLLINNSLEFEGSLKSPIRSISGGTATYAINSTDNVVIINTSPGSTFTIDAPTAGNKGRELILVNKSIASQSLSQNYINLSGSSTNQLPNNGRTHLKYNGTEIHQI